MDITLENIGKQFNGEFIFKNVDITFKSGGSYAITGANGSGKSTLLQVVSGYLRPSTGQINYGTESIEAENIFTKISYTSPYLELIEEFTLNELINFHFKFKKAKYSHEEFLEKSYLKSAQDKYIKHFSSGMKQRLKLSLALFSHSDIMFLDEPTTNLDTQGVDWYLQTIKSINTNSDKTILIASNQRHEYEFCDKEISIEKYK